MVVFPQAQNTEIVPAIFTVEPAGTIPQQPIGPPAIQSYFAPGAPIAVDNLVTNAANKPSAVVNTFPAQEWGEGSGGFLWFERFHVIPRAFDFGQLLSDQSSPIEVFCAFRRPPSREWTSFTNNAGAGVSLGGLPSLPVNVDPLSKFGTLTVDVSTAGDPFVDSDLVFTFLGGSVSISVPIELQRIVLFGLTAELPYSETLGFLTKVYTAKDGKEKRASLRKAPRQSWEYDYIMEDGLESAVLENLLFDFQELTFGVPVFFEDSNLEVGISAGATTITVDSTAFRDYRVGGQAVILTSQSIFDVLTIASGGITSTTLTFTSPTINAYVAGTKVFPLAPSTAEPRISGARWPVGLRRLAIRWHVADNDVDLGDLSPFATYKSKLLLDNGNSLLQATVARSFEQQFTTIDGLTGLLSQTSTWDRHKTGILFTLRAQGRQAVFELRGLIHALRGRQVSFYMPTDGPDLNVVANLLAASNTMDITNVGFAQFVRERQPKADLRVNFVDGSTPLLRAITASSSPSSTVDQLTVDINWPSTITPAEISRVDYLEKVRLDTDDVKIEYDRAALRARMVAPLKAVFE